MFRPLQNQGDQPMITLGAVASAHGVRGQFKVKPFTVVPSDVAAYGPVHLEDGRVL